jgi:hypothetical protein
VKGYCREVGTTSRKVDTFQRQAASILQDDPQDNTPVRETYVGTEFDRISGGEDDDEHSSSTKEDQVQSGHGSTDHMANTEHISLCLPSHFGRNWCNQNAAEDLAKTELHLREGQLNDSLHHIRIALGHKSSLFRHNIHLAHTQRLKTHAWVEVHAVESTVQHHARVYNRAQQVMVDLGASTNLLDRYKVLS